MKSKILIYAILILFIIAPILLAQDYDQKLPIEDAMKVFCGTWHCDGENIHVIKKTTFKLDGTYQWYLFKEDTKPLFTGTFKIEKAWLDKDGNSWCRVWRSFKGNSWQLTKINKTGTYMESCRYFVTENVPTILDDIQCDIFRCEKEK